MNFSRPFAIVLLAMLSIPLSAAELVAGNDFTKPIEAILSSWIIKPEEANLVTRKEEGKLSFLSLASTAPGSAQLRQDIKVPENAKTLTLSLNVRVSGVIKGEKAWNVPRVVILWKGDKEKKQQFPINFNKDAPWTKKTFTIIVPAEYTAFSLWVGPHSCTGVMDIAEMSIISE